MSGIENQNTVSMFASFIWFSFMLFGYDQNVFWICPWMTTLGTAKLLYALANVIEGFILSTVLNFRPGIS